MRAFEHALHGVSHVLRREPWWAEFWSGATAISWAKWFIQLKMLLPLPLPELSKLWKWNHKKVSVSKICQVRCCTK